MAYGEFSVLPTSRLIIALTPVAGRNLTNEATKERTAQAFLRVSEKGIVSDRFFRFAHGPCAYICEYVLIVSSPIGAIPEPNPSDPHVVRFGAVLKGALCPRIRFLPCIADSRTSYLPYRSSTSGTRSVTMRRASDIDGAE
jgi:hypothetical protein